MRGMFQARIPLISFLFSLPFSFLPTRVKRTYPPCASHVNISPLEKQALMAYDRRIPALKEI
jgi:hypothetical protein